MHPRGQEKREPTQAVRDLAMCLSTDGEWLGVPWVLVDRASTNSRSCRGHSKAGPQVAEQQHDETVAQQDVTPTKR